MSCFAKYQYPQDSPPPSHGRKVAAIATAARLKVAGEKNRRDVELTLPIPGIIRSK
jgi:hypothetical protein